MAFLCFYFLYISHKVLNVSCIDREYYSCINSNNAQPYLDCIIVFLLFNYLVFYLFACNANHFGFEYYIKKM